jgi:hypothetical protein
VYFLLAFPEMPILLAEKDYYFTVIRTYIAWRAALTISHFTSKLPDPIDNQTMHQVYSFQGSVAVQQQIDHLPKNQIRASISF